MTPPLQFRDVTIRYAPDAPPVLAGVDLTLREGELVLVTGRTGAGKSTLLRAVNGLVPHFTGGVLSGEVLVAGRSTATHPPRELADVVGIVGQDPLAGFVTDTVEEELAYAMEQLGIAPQTMRTRVEETLDLLGIADLRDRPLRTLSGGQQQRVAIGSVLTAGPRLLVLDEPTSALDPTSAEEVLAALLRLVHDLGVTVLVAEHRLERVIGFADRMLWVPGDGSVVDGSPAEVAASSDLVPPIVTLGRELGWQRLPLTVREARRCAAPLREVLTAPAEKPLPTGDPALTARGVTVTYGATVAVRDVDLTLAAGTVTTLLGRNGSGKSSLLWALTGVGRRRAGTVDTAGAVGLVPQTASDLLHLETVDAECAAADRWSRSEERASRDPGTDSERSLRRLRAHAERQRGGESEERASRNPGAHTDHPLRRLRSARQSRWSRSEERASRDHLDNPLPTPSCRSLLDRLAPGIDGAMHPRDLSEGQRLALVLAVQLTARPSVVLLDEPTRGLDYPAKAALAQVLRDLAAEGRAVLVATHDVEFAAEIADRAVVMAVGELVADGTPTQVLAGSPTFAPQLAKVFSPLPLLTVQQLRASLPAVTR